MMEYEHSMQSKDTNVLQELSGRSFTGKNLAGMSVAPVRGIPVIALDAQAAFDELRAGGLEVIQADLLDTNTHKFLDYIMTQLTYLMPGKATVEQIDRIRRIKVRIRDYMSITGKTDRKDARRKLIKAVVALRHLDICTVSRTEGELHMSVLDAYRIDTRGYVTVSVAVSFAQELSKWGPMWLPKSLYLINAHDNPHSYYIARKLVVYRHINHKRHEVRDHISLKVLMEACPDLPNVTERVKRYRVRPFMRDLYALRDKYGILSYFEIRGSDGISVDPEKIGKADIDDMMVWFELADYPEMDDRYRMIAP